VIKSSVIGVFSEQMITPLAEAMKFRGTALATAPLSMFSPDNNAAVPSNTK